MLFNDLISLSSYPTTTRLTFLAPALAAAAWGQATPTAAAVEIVPLADQSIYPQSIAPDALSFVCASDQTALAAYFAERAVPFEDGLVRPWQGRPTCHLYYEQTIK